MGFLLIFAVSLVATSLLYGLVLGGSVVVIRINGIPVTRDYLQEMSTLKSELQKKLENQYILVSENEVQERYNERYDIYNNDSNIKIAEIYIPF